MLLFLLKFYTMQNLFVKYERATGATPIITLWNSLINKRLKCSNLSVGILFCQ